jgi:regulator of protease activity HflC (stomatin/prohibitin superfamily)
MNNNSTRSVQRFVRFIVFIISFILLSVIPVTLIGFNTDVTLVISMVVLFIMFYVSSTIASMFFILPEWESMVILRLGKFSGVRGAGFFIIPPFIYSVAAIIDNRIVTQQVEATATLTKDNVPTRVTAAIEYKVENPKKAVIDVQNYRESVTWLATEALKNTIGSLDLKDLLSERDQIAQSLRDHIDTGAAVYGVDVIAVRITDLDTPPSLIEELAVIARARRAAEAKKVQAEAEILVAEKLSEAANILNSNTQAMRLREMQILNEMSKEESSMIIIYPYGDRTGENIAGATAGRIVKTKA